jgi:class 3 adenylate cyclase
MEQKPIQKTKLLPFGFAFIIIMMTALTVVGVYRMHENTRLMEQVVEENNVKVELLRKMYIAARERSIFLLKMAVTDDPFERDEYFLEFNKMATNFVVARRELRAMPLEPEEIELLDQQDRVTSVVAPQQNEIADLLVNDQLEVSRDMILKGAIPGQDRVLTSLNKVLDFERKKAADALNNAKLVVKETTRFMSISATLVIIISLLIAIYVVKKVRKDELLLIHAKDTLEETVAERTQQLKNAFENLKQHEAEIEEKNQELMALSNQLSKYLSPQVYSSIFSGQQEVKLDSKRKKITVLFSDIVGFTSATDRMESEDITYILNDYLTEMTNIALSYGGTIDKYIGDAIMLFFGDPESLGVRDDAIACVKTAMDMQNKLPELHEKWRKEGLNIPITARIGIHTGYCTVGNFGSDDRMDYTIIGGTVNLASRLEHEADPGTILISGDTQVLVEDEIDCESYGTVEIRGMAYPVETYKVLGAKS